MSFSFKDLMIYDACSVMCLAFNFVLMFLCSYVQLSYSTFKASGVFHLFQFLSMIIFNCICPVFLIVYTWKKLVPSAPKCPFFEGDRAVIASVAHLLA